MALTRDEIQLAITVLGKAQVGELLFELEKAQQKQERATSSVKADTRAQEEHNKVLKDRQKIRQEEDDRDQKRDGKDGFFSKLFAGVGGAEGGIPGLVSTAFAGLSAQQVYRMGEQAAFAIAPDVARRQADVISSIMVDIKTGLGDLWRDFMFGAKGDRQVILETREQELTRKIDNLIQRGTDRTGQESLEMRMMMIERQRLQEGIGAFMANRETPPGEQQVQGAVIQEQINLRGRANVQQQLQAMEELKARGESVELQNAKRELGRLQRAGGDPVAIAMQEKIIGQNLDTIGEEAKATIGRLMERAVKGIGDDMGTFIAKMKEAGFNVKEMLADMERAADRHRLAVRNHREQMVQEDLRWAEERAIQERTRQLGLDKLTPQERDLGAETARAARNARIGAEDAANMGVRAIGDKLVATARGLDDLHANQAARQAMGQMMPRMSDLARRQAGVDITPRMMQNAIEEATDAIAQGNGTQMFNFNAVYRAMRRQVIMMRANNREMNQFNRLFNGLNPQFPPFGGFH